MPLIPKERSLSQPHCYECHQPLTVYVSMETIISDDSTWEGMPLRGGTSRIFLCVGHAQEKYELAGYSRLGMFEWEQGAPV
jgi:hypothetical protein